MDDEYKAIILAWLEEAYQNAVDNGACDVRLTFYADGKTSTFLL